MRTRSAFVLLSAALGLTLAAPAFAEPFLSEQGDFRLETGTRWERIPDAVLRERMPPQPGQTGTHLGFSRVGSPDPLTPPYFLVRSEVQSIYPDTPRELQQRIASAAPPGLRGPDYDSTLRLLTFGDEVSVAEGGPEDSDPLRLRRLHGVFLGRERAVTFTFVSESTAFATFEPEFREVLKSFAFEEGHGGDRFARARAITWGLLGAASLGIGFYFSSRWRRVGAGDAG